MRSLAFVACALVALASCSKSTRSIPNWGAAKEVQVKSTDTWELAHGDTKVSCKMKRGPTFMELALDISGKGPKPRFETIRAFWDNEELTFPGMTSGEVPTSAKGDGWESSLTMKAKVHMWPDKDIVYLAVGKATWKLTVNP